MRYFFKFLWSFQNRYYLYTLAFALFFVLLFPFLRWINTAPLVWKMDVGNVWRRKTSPTSKNLQIPLSLLAQLEQNKQKKKTKKTFSIFLGPYLSGCQWHLCPKILVCYTVKYLLRCTFFAAVFKAIIVKCLKTKWIHYRLENY